MTHLEPVEGNHYSHPQWMLATERLRYALKIYKSNRWAIYAEVRAKPDREWKSVMLKYRTFDTFSAAAQEVEESIIRNKAKGLTFNEE
jgi:hypothetical protein